MILILKSLETLGPGHGRMAWAWSVGLAMVGFLDSIALLLRVPPQEIFFPPMFWIYFSDFRMSNLLDWKKPFFGRFWPCHCDVRLPFEILYVSVIEI